MGHDARIIRDLHRFGLGPGTRIADLGSQDFAASQMPWVNRLSKELFDALPFPEDAITASGEVFRRIGIDYTCFDVDRREGSIYLDFHSLRFPIDHYNRYDAVFNAGTSEHLAAPLGLMFFMHHATRAGGLMWHKVPMFGWANHGFNNLTPKFWHQLATYNDYEIVEAACLATETEGMGAGNFWGEHLRFFKGLEEFPRTSATGLVVFRKKHNFCFIPPFDIDDPTPGDNTERLMRDALAPFVAMGSLTESAIRRAMNWRFGRAAQSGIAWEGAILQVQQACDTAAKLVAEGQRDIASALYEAIVDECPAHAEAHCQLGWLRADHSIPQAIALFNQAASLAPGHAPYVRASLDLLKASRHLKLGGEILSVQAAYDRADKANSEGNTPLAIALLRSVVENFPDHGAARARLTDLLHAASQGARTS